MTAVCQNMFSKHTNIMIFLKIINSVGLRISGSAGILGWVTGALLIIANS